MVAARGVIHRHALRVIRRASSSPPDGESRNTGDDAHTRDPSIGRDNNDTLEVIMSEHTATPQFGASAIPSLSESARRVTGYWWVLLIAGIAWVGVALVILQFDQASVTTVGVLVGLMFLALGIENLTLAGLDVPMRWAWALFGVLFLVSAIVCFADPTDTFSGLADMLGFLFLIVGVWWMVRAFLERAISPLWWLGLISGILMTALAFWTSGQFFIEKAYVLFGLRRDLGVDAGHDHHRPRVRDSRRARRAVRGAGSERGRTAARLPPAPCVVSQARGRT
jgi:uncharacterized membrane protein HdeD (DUF308 family)